MEFHQDLWEHCGNAHFHCITIYVLPAFGHVQKAQGHLLAWQMNNRKTLRRGLEIHIVRIQFVGGTLKAHIENLCTTFCIWFKYPVYLFLATWYIQMQSMKH